METPSIRYPKLKSDTTFLPLEDGVFVQSDTSSCMLKGKSAYRWLATLSPYLNGEHALETLCAGLAEPQRDAVVRLVESLYKRGVLVDQQPEPALLAPAVRAAFKEQLAFIDHFADQPQQRFRTFRTSRVLLIGAGRSYLALAATLLRNGLEQIVLSTPAPERYVQALEPLADTLRAQDIAADIAVRGAPEQVDFSAYDMVVYCADAGSPHDIARLNERCLQAQVRFLPALIRNERALIGPLVAPDGGPCWMCAALRLTANEAEAAAAFWQAVALPSLFAAAPAPEGDPTAAMVGNSLGFEVFKALAGHLPTDTERAVILQDLALLTAQRAPVSAHPLCPACAAAPGKRAAAPVETQPDEAPTAWYQRLETLIDEKLGVFRAFVDEDRTQLPLKATTITFALPGAGVRSISAYSVDHLLDARLAGLQAAIGQYTAQIPDHTRIIWAGHADLLRQGLEAIAVEHFSTWAGACAPTRDPLAWIPARALRDGRTVYVPAAAVYPNTDLNRGRIFERGAAGIGVERSLAAAEAEGLRTLLAWELLRDIAAGATPLQAIDLAALAIDDPELRFLANSLTPFAAEVTLADVPEAPIALVLAGARTPTGRLTTSGVAATRREAVTRALIGLIGRLQTIQIDNQPLADDASLTDLVEWERQIAPAAAVRAEVAADPIRMLAAQGREACVVDITTTDIRATDTFQSVRVLAFRHPPASAPGRTA